MTLKYRDSAPLRIVTHLLVDRQQVRSVDRNLFFSMEDKVTLFETMKTTMIEVNGDKTKVPD